MCYSRGLFRDRTPPSVRASFWFAVRAGLVGPEGRLLPSCNSAQPRTCYLRLCERKTLRVRRECPRGSSADEPAQSRRK